MASPPHLDPSRAPPAPSQSPPECSSADSSLPPLWSPPLVHTRHSSVSVSRPHRAPWDLVRGPDPVPRPGSGLRSSLLQLPVSTLNPLPGDPPGPPPCDQVLVTVPSPERGRPRPRPQEAPPDMECSICFSHFNNIFRCPKMLQCQHTFCLECLARINVKSAEPGALQCPLCRRFTPLPPLGLPRLATDWQVLAGLPAAMQRVCSVRFVRSEGRLQVRRLAEAQRRWGQRSLACLRPTPPSLNVGLPGPPAAPPGGVGVAVFRLTERPTCRAFLLTVMVMMMMVLTGVIIFLLVSNRDTR